MFSDRSWASSMMIVSYARSFAVRLDLGEQDAVRHQLDERRVGVHLVGEADLPADRLAQRGLQLVGDTLGDRTGRDPARLGVPDHAPDTAPQLHTDLRDLRGLAGAGLPGDDHDLVVAYRLQDLVLLLADRELLRVRQGGHPRGTQREPLGCLSGLGGDLVQHGLPGLGLTDAARPFETAAEPVCIAERELSELGLEISEGSRHTEPRISPVPEERRTYFVRSGSPRRHCVEARDHSTYHFRQLTTRCPVRKGRSPCPVRSGAAWWRCSRSHWGCCAVRRRLSRVMRVMRDVRRSRLLRPAPKGRPPRPTSAGMRRPPGPPRPPRRPWTGTGPRGAARAGSTRTASPLCRAGPARRTTRRPASPGGACPPPPDRDPSARPYG